MLPRVTVRSDGRLRIALVEDEALYRDLLAAALDRGGFEVVGAFGDGETALRELPQLRPHVAVLDVDLGEGINGVRLGLQLRQELPDLGIVILSSHRAPALLRAVPDEQIAGWSYLLKGSVGSLELLQRALEGAAAGRVVLDPALTRTVSPAEGGALARMTPRQLEILRLMAEGLNNAGVAERLGISSKTVENHINQIFRT
ncbi:MAG TPA: response regulator transcription factor, partial [Limnochordia bacterium]|nr:response regulator transcription factor [Limnochordia bacterium]